MERLTDRATAEALKANAEKLRAVGIEPSIMDKRYIKLAEYENKEERKNGDKYFGLYALDETPEDNTRWLKCNPVTKQNRTPILTVDEIHKDPKMVKEAFEFFGLDEFISKRFTETR